MKVSETWLREWVNPAVSGEQIASQLTMAGLEVDSRSPVAGEFSHVVVAHVIQTAAHPQADKLTLCDIDAGTNTIIKVVCGASNVRPGLKVALALPGAHLPGDFVIKESMLRGQVSQGMLCSVSELGIDERSEGILELPIDAPIGMDIRDYLKLNDYVLDLDLTPNRADCFSMLGVARELAALNNMPFQSIPTQAIPPTSDEKLHIDVKEPKACPQYCSRIIRGIRLDSTTPLWITERLRRGGIRAKHPVVDVLNYVMLELGQPMHAFDLKKIEGNIEVRYGTSQETLMLLDGQDIKLDDQVLVIADLKKPLAIAGVMGGEESAVQEETTDILLESAFFNPLVIAGVARRYGLSSDSSQRFERGVDPALQIRAIERATELLQTIVGGSVGPINTLHTSEYLPKTVTVLFNPKKVQTLTGLDIPFNDMTTMLEGLGMTVVQKDQVWHVTVPSHRFDITLDVDLVEEIIRLYGYGNIQSNPATTTLKLGEINPSEQLSTKLALFLTGRGYHETISYSFVDPAFQEAIFPGKETMQLLNPISSELSQMRVSLWSGLLASMIHNSHRQQSRIKLFELGVVFDVNGKSIHERPCLGGLLMGEKGSLNWSELTGIFDFYDLKGDIESMLAAIPVNHVSFVADTHPALHPGQSARIVINNNDAGWIGVLHPKLQDELDLAHEVMLFELDLAPLLITTPPCYQKISKYPQIRRDLSLLVNKDVTAAQIEQSIRAVTSVHLLKAVDIFDVYMGESIPLGKKSLAVALTLQDDTRTLVDEEINAVINSILQKLEIDFSIILRDITRADS